MYQINREKFGEFIAQLRKEKGYTQKQLAQKLYISDKAVSKWETGVSIPDTALLIPLAQLLDVSVTELLLCCKKPAPAPMDDTTVETVVKTAICYSAAKTERPYGKNRTWLVWYLVCLIVGSCEMYAIHRLGLLSDVLWTALFLGAIFGAYFCFFVRQKLPAFYDQYAINGIFDGIFRMNVPGLSFNNRNWPHIITVGRIWSCATMIFLPLSGLILGYLCPSFWYKLRLYWVLIFTLGGLFLPLFWVGKRYENS